MSARVDVIAGAAPAFSTGWVVLAGFGVALLCAGICLVLRGMR